MKWILRGAFLACKSVSYLIERVSHGYLSSCTSSNRDKTRQDGSCSVKGCSACTRLAEINPVNQTSSSPRKVKRYFPSTQFSGNTNLRGALLACRFVLCSLIERFYNCVLLSLTLTHQAIEAGRTGVLCLGAAPFCCQSYKNR